MQKLTQAIFSNLDLSTLLTHYFTNFFLKSSRRHSGMLAESTVKSSLRIKAAFKSNTAQGEVLVLGISYPVFYFRNPERIHIFIETLSLVLV
jgi:hypothetical protein